MEAGPRTLPAAPWLGSGPLSCARRPSAFRIRTKSHAEPASERGLEPDGAAIDRVPRRLRAEVGRAEAGIRDDGERCNGQIPSTAARAVTAGDEDVSDAYRSVVTPRQDPASSAAGPPSVVLGTSGKPWVSGVAATPTHTAARPWSHHRPSGPANICRFFLESLGHDFGDGGQGAVAQGHIEIRRRRQRVPDVVGIKEGMQVSDEAADLIPGHPPTAMPSVSSR